MLEKAGSLKKVFRNFQGEIWIKPGDGQFLAALLLFNVKWCIPKIYIPSFAISIDKAVI